MEELGKGTLNDISILVYSSDPNHPNYEESLKILYDYDTAGLRFRKLKIPTVVIAAYDMYLEGHPPHIDSRESPAVYLLPATAEGEPSLKRYKGKKVSTLGVMKFIEKNAGKPFVLPEGAHI